MNTLKKSNNFAFIIAGLLIAVALYFISKIYL